MFKDYEQDIVIEISKHVDDRNRISFLSTCRRMNNYKTVVKFVGSNCYWEKMIKLPYYNSFRYIDLSDTFLLYMKDNSITFPLSLEYLWMPHNFNQSIERLIPYGVKSLSFRHFNQSIKGHIPASVEYLDLGYAYDLPLQDCIPNTLRILDLGVHFNQPISNALPEGLKEIAFGSNFFQSIKGNIPSTTIHLEFAGKICWENKNDIPPNVTKLSINCAYHRNMRNMNEYIPSNINHLILSGDLLTSINNYMTGYVTHLTYHGMAAIQDRILSTVIYLKFGFNFNKSVNCCLPDRLKTLKFGHNYNHPLGDINFPFPSTIESIEFGCRFNNKIHFPSNSCLKYLKFGYEYDQILHRIPPSVETVVFDVNYKRPILFNNDNRVKIIYMDAGN